MINDERQDVMMNAYCHAVSMCFAVIAEDAGCPHVLMRPRLYKDGNQWCASYGDMPEGVQGFGDSPGAAMRDFDKQWHTKATPTPDASAGRASS